MRLSPALAAYVCTTSYTACGVILTPVIWSALSTERNTLPEVMLAASSQRSSLRRCTYCGPGRPGYDGDVWIGTLDRGVFHYRAGQLENLAALPDPQVLSVDLSGESSATMQVDDRGLRRGAQPKANQTLSEQSLNHAPGGFDAQDAPVEPSRSSRVISRFRWVPSTDSKYVLRLRRRVYSGQLRPRGVGTTGELLPKPDQS